ncbi:gliding motility lipoprotein GldH [Sphingobacterium rhinopitheci]|uniref:gliding motility lipoprotein GldH n=1 Tax=Sphingobacterium rhinopitheci TaxID=2781960 RepID=UPI001F520388|nr:gliding motility lipoprotein GldH [Sphingobacterium rhinopitheci]MCI0921879.1 gliding motility lipoprotein GldH [Sphingobacterium rhinopitheci]
MVKYILYSFFIVTGLSSCTNNAIYDQNSTIKDKSWTYDQKPAFTVHVADNKPTYNIYINLRHTNTYDYSNLYVLLHEKGNKLKDTAYRNEIQLAALDGRWLGKSAASLYEVQYLAKENFSFPDTGKYTFTIEQNMRENPLKDIVDIGLKVVKQ